MFRVRLAATIGISFCFVLLLGGVLYWISYQVALNVQRSQSAYEAFDHYEQLSHEAYRHFKQRMDNPATGGADGGVESSKHRLYAAMEALRSNAVTLLAKNNAEDWQSKPAELERVARFTAFLEASQYWFDEVERHADKAGTGKRRKPCPNSRKKRLTGNSSR